MLNYFYSWWHNNRVNSSFISRRLRMWSYWREWLSYLWKNNLCFLSKICEKSSVECIKMPVLYHIRRTQNGVLSGTLAHTIWLCIMHLSICNIHLYIIGVAGEMISSGKKRLHCTLLYVPAPHYKIWQK